MTTHTTHTHTHTHNTTHTNTHNLPRQDRNVMFMYWAYIEIKNLIFYCNLPHNFALFLMSQQFIPTCGRTHTQRRRVWVATRKKSHCEIIKITTGFYIKMLHRNFILHGVRKLDTRHPRATHLHITHKHKHNTTHILHGAAILSLYN